jgi:ABC-2 type transport system ATP-binding protein
MGKTILISSHILHELAELCNTVGIIERGKLLFAGTVREAISRAKVGHVIHVGVTDRTQQAAELLAKIKGVKKVSLVDADGAMGAASSNGHKHLISVTFEDAAGSVYSDLPNILVNNGFRLTRFAEEPVNLETAFMRLTKGMVQ